METHEQRQAREMAEAQWLLNQPIRLPQGTTGLPPTAQLIPGAQVLTPEEQALCDQHGPQLFGTPSELLGRNILYAADLLEHLHLVNTGAQPAELGKRGRGRPRKPVDAAALAAKQAKSEAYKQWVQDCQDRKSRIQSAKAELATRKQQCALYIKEVEDALAYWEASPVPKQP